MNSLIYQDRLVDCPYVDLVMHGLTTASEEVIRPATSHWHMVFSNQHGKKSALLVGPCTASGVVSWGEGAEILWVRFKLGTFMPHLPPVKFLDSETILPDASNRSFWLKGSVWEFPTFDNVDAFIDRLVGEKLLIHDPVVNAVLDGHIPSAASRTVRHRFLQVIGQPQNRVLQLERARQAMALLQQCHSILDVVSEVGYADQSHLTRSLKYFLGYTPGQIVSQSR